MKTVKTDAIKATLKIRKGVKKRRKCITDLTPPPLEYQTIHHARLPPLEALLACSASRRPPQGHTLFTLAQFTFPLHLHPHNSSSASTPNPSPASSSVQIHSQLHLQSTALPIFSPSPQLQPTQPIFTFHQPHSPHPFSPSPQLPLFILSLHLVLIFTQPTAPLYSHSPNSPYSSSHSPQSPLTLMHLTAPPCLHSAHSLPHLYSQLAAPTHLYISHSPPQLQSQPPSLPRFSPVLQSLPN